jgi:hypothetical protein
VVKMGDSNDGMSWTEELYHVLDSQNNGKSECK